jgi:small multidrug resistance pump
MAWLFLTGAILCEVAGTLALRATVTGRRLWYLVVGVGYVVSFVLLSLTLRRGIGIGVAYGVWTASGVALIAVLSRVLFRESLGRVRILGIALIAAGVTVVELGAAH